MIPALGLLLLCVADATCQSELPKVLVIATGGTIAAEQKEPGTMGGYEIKKSWEVYKERVTPELANSTPYFRDALNEMLAEGKKVF